MDKERFPNYFIIAFGLYSILLLLVLGPFFTILGMTADFILLFAVVLLPLVLFVAYYHGFAKEHQTTMRIIITAASVLISAFLAVFVLPIV